MNCDSCGVKVSTTGYLGGGIICRTCSKLKYVEEDEEALEERREKYGGNND